MKQLFRLHDPTEPTSRARNFPRYNISAREIEMEEILLSNERGKGIMNRRSKDRAVRGGSGKRKEEGEGGGGGGKPLLIQRKIEYY